MNWARWIKAMLPEHALLVGILVLLCLEIAKGRPGTVSRWRSSRWSSPPPRRSRCNTGNYVGAPFAGHFSVGPAASLRKFVIIALTVPVVLISRDDFKRHALLRADAVVAVRRLPAGVVDSLLTMFLGLEIMSLPVYAWCCSGSCAPTVRRPRSSTS